MRKILQIKFTKALNFGEEIRSRKLNNVEVTVTTSSNLTMSKYEMYVLCPVYQIDSSFRNRARNSISMQRFPWHVPVRQTNQIILEIYYYIVSYKPRSSCVNTKEFLLANIVIKLRKRQMERKIGKDSFEISHLTFHVDLSLTFHP